MRNALKEKLKEHLYNYGLLWLIFGVPIIGNILCWLCTGYLIPHYLPML